MAQDPEPNQHQPSWLELPDPLPSLDVAAKPGRRTCWLAATYRLQVSVGMPSLAAYWYTSRSSPAAKPHRHPTPHTHGSDRRQQTAGGAEQRAQRRLALLSCGEHFPLVKLHPAGHRPPSARVSAKEGASQHTRLPLTSVAAARAATVNHVLHAEVGLGPCALHNQAGKRTHTGVALFIVGARQATGGLGGKHVQKHVLLLLLLLHFLGAFAC